MALMAKSTGRGVGRRELTVPLRIAVKRLSAVETDPERSNQHEFPWAPVVNSTFQMYVSQDPLTR